MSSPIGGVQIGANTAGTCGKASLDPWLDPVRPFMTREKKEKKKRKKNWDCINTKRFRPPLLVKQCCFCVNHSGVIKNSMALLIILKKKHREAGWKLAQLVFLVKTLLPALTILLLINRLGGFCSRTGQYCSTDGIKVPASPPWLPGQTGSMIESCQRYLWRGKNVRPMTVFPS